MRKIGFRARLLLILALFAAVPAVVLSITYGWSVAYAVREVSGTAAWDSVAQSGRAVLEVSERHAVTPEEKAAVEKHRELLSVSLTNANRLAVILEYAPLMAALLAFLAVIILAIATSRVAGHLSRQLSRPLQELVGWTERIARGEALPETANARGAPEFEVLRQRMRRMARELARGRERALEAERLRAFRESARQVAHELKNPLTPIRFAVARLRRDAPPELAESVEVLDVETRRMEEIARNFAIFGKLPEGLAAEIDIAEMVSYAARAAVPDGFELSLEVQPDLPVVRGYHDALSRAISNVLLNAVEASGDAGRIQVRARRSERPGWIDIEIADAAGGMSEEKLATIWEPYVTYKSGGTGLGLAIARQTVEAHGGTVDAASQIGNGTVVRFHLPAGNAGEVVHDVT